MSEDVAETLKERGSRYGNFFDHASCVQSMERIAMVCDAWPRMSDDQKEAVHMILHKLGRILCGDPDYDDSWRDIAGYAMLVCDRLNRTIAK